MQRRRGLVGLLAAWLAGCQGATAEGRDDVAALRARMVERTIEHPEDSRDPVRDARVVDAMQRVPRHEFVPEPIRQHAYADRALPIGHEQTISQPYMVAKMTELLAVRPGDRVLEVGTGSGYQAAVLAELGCEVYTIDIVAPLAEEARARLDRLGYGRVRVRAGDGYLGWPEHAPFDAIVVTASATHLPPPLVEQLKPGGRLVIPAGERPERSELLVVRRGATAQDVKIDRVMPVAFVPLTGERAESRRR